MATDLLFRDVSKHPTFNFRGVEFLVENFTIPCDCIERAMLNLFRMVIMPYMNGSYLITQFFIQPDLKLYTVSECVAQYAQHSLGEQLLRRPDLTYSLTGVLLIFGLERVAIILDIVAML
ncbi:uncharacterized protein DEA37_0010344 [Paragonimus westermani]|uniref:Uncharacterized protein n=1 Tax=Paragonimus westermani TaxID=34504 RepID=A0A5J4N6X0_9TREM|nr:uncharacterized protein DEA37_0010344 [Paragonimus westermani]